MTEKQAKIAKGIAMQLGKQYPWLWDDLIATANLVVVKLSNKEVNNTYIRKYVYGRLYNFIQTELRNVTVELKEVMIYDSSLEVMELLDSLCRNEIDKAVINLSIQGYMDKEIAQIIGISYGKVRKVRWYLRKAYHAATDTKHVRTRKAVSGTQLSITNKCETVLHRRREVLQDLPKQESDSSASPNSGDGSGQCLRCENQGPSLQEIDKQGRSEI